MTLRDLTPRGVTRVVALGDLMTDVVALASGPVAAGSDTRSRVRVTGGGSAANTAAWLAATGHPVTYVGRVGADAFGQAAVDELVATGVDVLVARDPDRPTGVCVVVVTPDGERSMFPDAGANAGLADEDLPDRLLAAPAHLHLSGYSLLTEGSRPAARHALARARSAGLTISVDPSSVGPMSVVGPAQVLGWIAGTDLLLANDDEALLLAGGGTDPVAAAVALTASFGEVVVKLGPDGAAWARAGADPIRVPAVDVTAAGGALDTTGAGDCFAAGFLPAWLAGAGPREALEAGCALAARVVTQIGARPPAPPAPPPGTGGRPHR
jgi:sugar/nucleoside kinase (ribokinase family)